MSTTEFRTGTFLVCRTQHMYGLHNIRCGSIAKVKSFIDNKCLIEVDDPNINYCIDTGCVDKMWGLDVNTEMLSIGVQKSKINKLPKDYMHELKKQFIWLRKSGINDAQCKNEIITIIDSLIMKSALE